MGCHINQNRQSQINNVNIGDLALYIKKKTTHYIQAFNSIDVFQKQLDRINRPSLALQPVSQERFYKVLYLRDGIGRKTTAYAPDCDLRSLF